jgi:hypothetical protein
MSEEPSHAQRVSLSHLFEIGLKSIVEIVQGLPKTS